MCGHVYEVSNRAVGGDVLHLVLLAHLLHHPPSLIVQQLSVIHPLPQGGKILFIDNLTFIFLIIFFFSNFSILKITFTSPIKLKT